MSRVHDMGGRFGDGPVTPEAEDDPKFTEDWQARALALTLACGAMGQWNIDMSRHARESIAPKDYTRFSYYEKWIAGLTDILVAMETLDRSDLAADPTQGQAPLQDKALRAADVPTVLAKGAPADRPSDVSPVFKAGDVVKTRKAGNTTVQGGHTRLPGYAAGTMGRVLRCHGTHVLPDSSAHGLGEAPEPLYAVAFKAGDLWLHPEHPEDEVIIDLWQSYLAPA